MLKDARAKLHVTGAVDKKNNGGVEECFFLKYRLTQAKYCVNRPDFIGNETRFLIQFDLILFL